MTPAAAYPYFENGGFPLALAHRGGALTGRNVGLENSMVAFHEAVRLGYRYLETDVQATADGVLLAFHDPTLDRTTNGHGTIEALPYREVKGVLIDGREPIPLLDDVLGTWPEVRVNIDCKSDDALAPLVEILQRHQAWDRVCVASFSTPRLIRLRRALGPRVATSLGREEIAALRLLPLARVHRWMAARGGQAAQVPVRRRSVQVLTPRFVRDAHAAGLQVHVWTIDDPAQMHQLLDLGVDGIISDRIDVLRQTYRQRGIWQDAAP